jgi:hypothetical protein
VLFRSQPIRIPTCANRRIIVLVAVGVPFAGKPKQFEIFVTQVIPSATYAAGEFGTTLPMLWIPTLIDAFAVMEQRKQPDNLDLRTRFRRQDASIPFHPAPVVRPMNGIRAAMMRGVAHGLPELLKVDVHRFKG